MNNWPMMRQDSDIANVGPEGQAGRNVPAVPGKWRRLTVRLGAFEIGYASVRVGSPRRRDDESYRPVTIRRASAPKRFIEHLGYTTAALIFLGGTISLLAMQSDAFVSHSANNWPIVQSDEKAGAVQTAATSAKGPVATPVPAAITLQPSIVRAAIRDGIADLVRKGDMNGVVQSAALGQGMSGDGAPPMVQGPLDRIPAVAAAVKRAMATGEVQNWAAGNYEGVVVVGDSYQSDGSVCREGSILARNGGPESRTQPFEHCARAPNPSNTGQ